MTEYEMAYCVVCEREIKKKFTTIVDEIRVCGDCYFKVRYLKSKGEL